MFARSGPKQRLSATTRLTTMSHMLGNFGSALDMRYLSVTHGMCTSAKGNGGETLFPGIRTTMRLCLAANRRPCVSFVLSGGRLVVGRVNHVN